MNAYPGLTPRAKDVPRAEAATDPEHIYHLRHFWRPNGCYAWVTTVRVRGRREPFRILGEHIRR